jgi:hypothetical protein
VVCVAAPLVAAVALSDCGLNEIVDVGANFEAGEPFDATEGADVDAARPREAEADGARPEEAAADDAAPEAEAGPPMLSELCIPKPSFEETPDLPTPMPVLSAPPGWTSCNGSNSQSASACGLQPTDGNTCLGLSIGVPLLIPAASVDVVPCGPVQPGATYAVTVDLALDAPSADGGQAGEPPALQLRGSNTACDAQGDLLWRFSGLDSACGWKTLCGTFDAGAAYSHFLLVPETSSSTSLVFVQTEMLVDNLRTTLACPR